VDGPEFYVLSPANDWRWWVAEIPRAVGRVVTVFDAPDHPYGQWSVTITRTQHVITGTHSDKVMLRVQFLVDDAPWARIRPGMVLPYFYGTHCLSRLIVVDEQSWFGGLSPPEKGAVHVLPDVACCECGGEVGASTGQDRTQGKCLACGVELTVVKDHDAN
jgi:hypothetical protein